MGNKETVGRSKTENTMLQKIEEYQHKFSIEKSGFQKSKQTIFNLNIL